MKADAGVIITASHNPKEYNGVKLYDETGRQLIPSEIVPISKKIESIKYFESVFPNVEPKYVTADVEMKYIEMVKSIKLNNVKEIKAVFTPLHGTGGVFIKDILPNVHLVEQQMIADPDFSTLNLPNPENEEAFALALELGNSVDADILLATDPDADRVGCMIKDNGYHFLSGNEIAVILLKYILDDAKSKNRLSNRIVYKSIVSSKLGKMMCQKYGVTMEETLTGFKYIGKLMNETKKKYLFGYEESNGCIINDDVRDKDAMQAAYLLYEACSYYKTRGLTLLDVLKGLYDEFGKYANKTISYMLDGQGGQLLKEKIMQYFKENSIDKAINKIDYNIEPGMMKDNIVKFDLNNGSVIIRPSGTEPKIKVYLELNGSNVDNELQLLERYITGIINNIKGERDE